MNYQKHYDNLIQTRLFRILDINIYYEKHHIIPKSMGGSNTKENLVPLTAREHFIAYWLLYRIYKNRETASAFWSMCGKGNKTMKRYIPSSRAYEEARLSHIKENKGRPKHTEESKRNIGIGNSKPKPKDFGSRLSKLMIEGGAEKISKANKGLSRGKGRKVPWATGRPKSIFIKFDINKNEIEKYIGLNNLPKIYKFSGLSRSMKNNKLYKGYYWEIKNTFKI